MMWHLMIAFIILFFHYNKMKYIKDWKQEFSFGSGEIDSFFRNYESRKVFNWLLSFKKDF